MLFAGSWPYPDHSLRSSNALPAAFFSGASFERVGRWKENVGGGGGGDGEGCVCVCVSNIRGAGSNYDN